MLCLKSSAMKKLLILFVCCFLLPHFIAQHLFAQSDLTSLKKQWFDEKYEDVVGDLKKLRKELDRPSQLLQVDYMIGTSLCRFPDRLGLKILKLIPRQYRHLRKANFNVIRKETEVCSNLVGGGGELIAENNTSRPSFLTYPQPGVSGKGGIEQTPSDGSLEEDFLKHEEEYSSRLLSTDSKKRKKRTSLSRFKALAGDDYKGRVSRHFIVIGKGSKRALKKKTSIFEETLSRFLDQFGMEPPLHYTSVYLMGNADQMVNFAKKNHYLDIPKSMWGYTFPYDGSIVMDEARGLGTIGHEIFHRVLFENFQTSPPWLNEGYAALFEEFYLEDDKIVGRFREDHWRIKYLSSEAAEPPSLTNLIQMDWRDFDAESFDLAQDNVVSREAVVDQELRRHINHSTAKFFALYLQNKRMKLEAVYHAFKAFDYLESQYSLEEDYRMILENVLGSSIKEIETDFQEWLSLELGF